MLNAAAAKITPLANNLLRTITTDTSLIQYRTTAECVGILHAVDVGLGHHAGVHLQLGVNAGAR